MKEQPAFFLNGVLLGKTEQLMSAAAAVAFVSLVSALVFQVTRDCTGIVLSFLTPREFYALLTEDEARATQNVYWKLRGFHPGIDAVASADSILLYQFSLTRNPYVTYDLRSIAQAGAIVLFKYLVYEDPDMSYTLQFMKYPREIIERATTSKHLQFVCFLRHDLGIPLTQTGLRIAIQNRDDKMIVFYLNNKVFVRSEDINSALRQDCSDAIVMRLIDRALSHLRNCNILDGRGMVARKILVFLRNCAQTVSEMQLELKQQQTPKQKDRTELTLFIQVLINVIKLCHIHDEVYPRLCYPDR
jgi:hypothetical protein